MSKYEGKKVAIFVVLILTILFIWCGIDSVDIWLPAIGESVNRFWDRYWIVIISALVGIVLTSIFQIFYRPFSKKHD